MPSRSRPRSRLAPRLPPHRYTQFRMHKRVRCAQHPALGQNQALVERGAELGMHPLMMEPRKREQERNWMAWRRPETASDRQLQDETVAWLARLPEAARPDTLARTFPRIANQLARTLHDPVQLERYMDSLLVDHRGNRQGFPAPVALELMKLHLHFQERRLYAPARRQVSAATGQRAARYADHEMLNSIESPATRSSRRAARSCAQKCGVWAQILKMLGFKSR